MPPGRILFNTGILLAGLCALAAGWGFFRALRERRHPVLGALTGLFVAVFGAAFVMGGLFPCRIRSTPRSGWDWRCTWRRSSSSRPCGGTGRCAGSWCTSPRPP